MSDRLKLTREVVRMLNGGVALVTHPANRRYLSGFPADDHAPDESSGVLVVTMDAAILYTSPTNLPWAQGSVREGVDAQAWQRPWQEFVGQQLEQLNAQRVVFEDKALSVADYTTLSESAPSTSFLGAGDALAAMRTRKDDEEIGAIARAAHITDAAFLNATSELQPGITERELAWQLDLLMHDLGADGPGFPTIVASGPHSARPHHEPSDRQIAPGEPVVIDMGAAVTGYRADLTRTICLGEPPPEYRERYNSVLAAQRAALSAIRPGMSGQAADSIARDSLGTAGFGDAFIHGLGHGVGLQIHEAPSLGTKSLEFLEPGHVITIEPGIYFEGWGGIRIEDLCVVRDDGLEVLSAAPK